ncbi:hypothetical protein NE237_020705 [Protea cynaroides]|uniref:Uncharacterized protein n=1 Tax=Protea cynaroides TaxID=273540 RepID=A0A9Q0H7S5_9MAGN|nr:hypothetical protein NE237_020705 [Protea cynaroides]
MEKQIMDYTLVPSGLVILVAYHIWLLYRIIYQPMNTVVGINDMPNNEALAVQTLRNNIMAGTLLATTAVTHNSIIVLMVYNFSFKPSAIVFGDKMMFCFLLAFLFTVQSIRYYSHASILVQVPVKKCKQLRVYVENALTKGSYFWALGLTALYFSFPLFMWFFGPIPMFMCCLLLVFTLYFLDILDGGSATRDVPKNGDMEQWSYVV